MISPNIMALALSYKTWKEGYRWTAYIQIGILVICFATLPLWKMEKEEKTEEKKENKKEEEENKKEEEENKKEEEENKKEDEKKEIEESNNRIVKIKVSKIGDNMKVKGTELETKEQFETKIDKDKNKEKNEKKEEKKRRRKH